MGGTREDLIEALKAHRVVANFLDEAKKRSQAEQELCTHEGECETCLVKEKCDDLQIDFHEEWDAAAERARGLTEAALKAVGE